MADRVQRPTYFEIDDALAVLEEFRKYMEGALTDDELRCLAVTHDMLWNFGTDPNILMATEAGPITLDEDGLLSASVPVRPPSQNRRRAPVTL